MLPSRSSGRPGLPRRLWAASRPAHRAEHRRAELQSGHRLRDPELAGNEPGDQDPRRDNQDSRDHVHVLLASRLPTRPARMTPTPTATARPHENPSSLMSYLRKTLYQRTGRDDLPAEGVQGHRPGRDTAPRRAGKLKLRPRVRRQVRLAGIQQAELLLRQPVLVREGDDAADLD